MLEQIREAATGDANVLVTGESGTGKELVAKAIHAASAVSHAPFIAKNCAALTESLAEAELFGHAAKAGIAGADPEGAPGWFEMASGGTLFLDEIQGLNAALQDKFLRVLQEKEVWRLRGRKPIQVNVKVIAATDTDPEAAVEAGRLRGPLYYRFGTRIQVSPLRERKEDIPLLAHCFLDRQVLGSGSPTRAISHRALQALLDYSWPGNVRELENAVSTAIARAGGREVLFSWDFPLPTASGAPLADEGSETADTLGSAACPSTRSAPVAPRPMAVVEKEKIMEALEYCRGNLSQACRLLGYKSRQTMLNKMDGYGIDRNHGDLKD
jgi:transcriptional regulator with PAS, ATPase and Fis domain